LNFGLVVNSSGSSFQAIVDIVAKLSFEQRVQQYAENDEDCEEYERVPRGEAKSD
jgi:hypothetical protein